MTSAVMSLRMELREVRQQQAVGARGAPQQQYQQQHQLPHDVPRPPPYPATAPPPPSYAPPTVPPPAHAPPPPPPPPPPPQPLHAPTNPGVAGVLGTPSDALPERVRFILHEGGVDMSCLKEPEVLEGYGGRMWRRYEFTDVVERGASSGSKILVVYHATTEFGAVGILRDRHIRPGPSSYDSKYITGIGYEGTWSHSRGTDWTQSDDHPRIRRTLDHMVNHSKHACGLVFEVQVAGETVHAQSAPYVSVKSCPGIVVTHDNPHRRGPTSLWCVHSSDAIPRGFLVDLSWAW